MSRLWDKGGDLDGKILKFTAGNDVVLDRRLVPFDIQASIAHVAMLEHVNLIASQEATLLSRTLTEIGTDFGDGKWEIQPEDEDCHTAIEGQLVKRLGDLGGKVHLGRSRNDQVLVALRLYLNEEINKLREANRGVRESLKNLIEQQGATKIPGYTHGQQAMPSSVALWALGFESELKNSASLLDAAHHLADQCPLGSAAGYGTPGLSLDRQFVSEQLGFSRVQEPVTACQLSRGKAESALLFATTHLLSDVGRLAADVCLFASQEFGFVTLAEEVSTGSSIMPQKRNPDVFELIRAHASQAPHDLAALLALTAKMPSGYHRDLQLMKEVLFRGIDRAQVTLEITAYAITKIQFHAKRAEQITQPGIHAAEAAFALVQQEGISFREAYRRVAKQTLG